MASSDELEGMTSARQERLALGYALASVLLWATVATGFKLGLRELAPVQLLFLGCCVALAFFAVARCFVSAKLTVREHGATAAMGLVTPLAYYLVLFEAYDRLPAQIAQPLNYTWAIAIAVLAVPILRQSLSWRGWGGVFVGYVGVAVILSRGEFAGFAHFDAVGVALALFSTLLWAGYWIATVRLRVHPVPMMLNGFAVATPLVALVCHFGPGLPALSARTLGFGAWVGLVEIGVTFLLWQRALRLTSKAGRISQLIFLSPFLSLVLIAVVLGERIHPSAVVGLALIVGGLVLSRR